MLGAAPIRLAAVGSYAEADIPVAPACGERVCNAKKHDSPSNSGADGGGRNRENERRRRLKTLGGVSFETRFNFYPSRLDRARRRVASALHRAAEATTEAAPEKAHEGREANPDSHA